MKLQLNTSLVGLFSGTYNTIWELPEMENENGDMCYAEYKLEDLIKSIAECYRDNQDEIAGDMPGWVKSIVFSGEFDSPREYNFSTDSLDFEVEINEEEMVVYLHSLKESEHFIKWLSDKFTSRDGFWSYTPNTPDGIFQAIRDESSKLDQSVSALISYAMRGETDHRWDNELHAIEFDLCEQWASNDYGGMDYKLVKE